ncbi:unnamed protein product, partial [Cladocopium goreaui]
DLRHLRLSTSQVQRMGLAVDLHLSSRDPSNESGTELSEATVVSGDAGEVFCQVRYQVLGEKNDGPCVLMLHGLLVNADHWRQNLPPLAEAGLRVYALDLLGNGYTDKLDPVSQEAASINGERNRDLRDVETNLVLGQGVRKKVFAARYEGKVGKIEPFLKDILWDRCPALSEMSFDGPIKVELLEGDMLTSRIIMAVDETTHPAASPELCLQAAIDRPEQIQGLLLVNPRLGTGRFHVKLLEHLRTVGGPVISGVQSILRVGKLLYDLLKSESSVTEILKEPYYNTSQVTSELVQVLRAPLLLEGALESTLVTWTARDFCLLGTTRSLDAFAKSSGIGRIFGREETRGVVNDLILAFVQNLS